MGIRKEMHSARRWQLLRILANADQPLTYQQLAQHLDVNKGTVHTLMVRPIRAGWVESVIVPNRPKPGIRAELTLTDEGRRYLESLADTD